MFILTRSQTITRNSYQVVVVEVHEPEAVVCLSDRGHLVVYVVYEWYRELAELFVETTVYNSFILYRKLNPNTTTTHLLFRQNLIEKFVQFHLFGSRNSQTGPNATGVNNNPLRLIERHFISNLPSTQNKARAQRKCVRCTKLGIRRDTRFWCRECEVALCFHECFEVYHTKKDITRWLGMIEESEDSGDDS